MATIKLHFASKAKAFSASVDGSITAGQRTSSGAVKTWIAKVAKAFPEETAQQAAARISAN